ncbi:MAG: hypothetical protein Q8L90_01760, partial [Bacteroidota bacterium]|nr:hypothetical protein [Bacteroidota bacterium]
MDYKQQLLKEHSRANTDTIANAIGNNAVEFKKIIYIVYNEKAPLPQRASWLLSTMNDKHPDLLLPYISLFISTIKKIKIDGIKRNMLAVLASNKISKNLQGKLVNLCFDLLLSSDETVAVKVY